MLGWNYSVKLAMWMGNKWHEVTEYVIVGVRMQCLNMHTDFLL